MSYAKYLSFPTSWKDPVANLAALPATGNGLGDARVTQDTGTIWVWNGSAWLAPMAGSVAWGTIGGTLSAQTDLQAALDAKVGAVNSIGPTAGNVTVSQLYDASQTHLAAQVDGLNILKLYGSDTSQVFETGVAGTAYMGDIAGSSSNVQVRVLGSSGIVDLGDVNSVANGNRIELDDTNQRLIVQANSEATIQSIGVVAIGDHFASGNSTQITIEDTVGQIDISTVGSVRIGDTHSPNSLVDINAGLGTVDFQNFIILQDAYTGISALEKLYTTSANLSIGASGFNKGTFLVVSASSRTITLDPGVAAGYTIRVIRQGTGSVTIAPGAGVTLNSKSGLFAITARYGFAQCLHVGSNSWIIMGDV